MLVEVEAAGEHRRRAEQRALVVGQQVVGPLDRVAQRELAFRARRRPLQQPEPIGESIPDLDGAHRGHPRGRQLDARAGARRAVVADLGHRRRGLRVAEPEVGPDGTRPVDEQRDGVGGRRRRRARAVATASTVSPSTRERLARRGEDP